MSMCTDSDGGGREGQHGIFRHVAHRREIEAIHHKQMDRHLYTNKFEHCANV